MSDDKDKESFLDGFTLSPNWAKKSADEYATKQQQYSPDFDDGEGRRDRRGGKPRFDRDENRGRGDGRQPNRMRRDREGGFGQRDRDAGQPQSTPRFQPAQRDEGFRSEHGPRRFDGPRQQREPLPPPPFDIRFLPEQKALSIIAMKVQSGHRAIPLRDLVKLFFDNPESTDVRLEFNEENRDRRFYQCKACGWFALTADEARAHMMTAHFGEYFDSEEQEIDPPAGNFTSIARCGFTGKLLAPPNHHSYNRKILQMLRTECAGKSEDEYRARIELVSDPELIEQWRKESSRQTVFFEKERPEDKPKAQHQKRHAQQKPAAAEQAPEAAPEVPVETAAEAPESAAPEAAAPEAAPAPAPARRMSAEEADRLFLENIAPKLLKEERQVTISHAVSKTLSDRNVINAISRAWDREQVIQTASLFFAVRGGLRSRKLALFRVAGPRREEFVMHKQPTALDATHAVPELRLILDYITIHPGCTRAQLIADLIPEGTEQAKADGVLKQVAFVTERGYVIEYFNGVLALPEEHPHFQQPRVPGKDDKSAGAKTDKAPVPEKTESAEPAAETPQAPEAEPAPEAEVAPAPEQVPESAPEPKESAPETVPEEKGE